MLTVLHAGCGYAPLPEWLDGYREVRFDIDPACEPEIVGTITALGSIGPYDALLCSHCLEHLYPHEVGMALRQFYGVLKPGGFAAVFVPDLEGVKPTDEVMFVSPAGPIAGLDLIYGHRKAIELGMKHMAHHTGFTATKLAAEMHTAGFRVVTTHQLRTSAHNLMGVGIK